MDYRPLCGGYKRLDQGKKIFVRQLIETNLLVDLELRHLLPLPKAARQSEEVDILVKHVRHVLLAEGRPVEQPIELRGKAEKVANLLRLARASDDVTAALRYRNEVWSDFSDFLLRSAVKVKSNGDGLARVPLLRSPKRKFHRIAMRWRLRAARRSLAGLTSYSLDFNGGDVVTAFGVLSGVLVVSGYLYMHSLLAYFGLRSALYFGIADYLAASVDHIKEAALAIAFAIAGFWLRVQLDARASPSDASRRFIASEGFGWMYAGGVWITVLIAAAQYLLEDDTVSTVRVATIAYLLWLIMYGPTWLRRMGFQKRGQLIAGVVFSFFAIQLSMNWASTVDRLRAETVTRKRDAVHLKGDSPLPSGEYRTIASNSSYVFLYEPSERRAYAVPKESIAYAEAAETVNVPAESARVTLMTLGARAIEQMRRFVDWLSVSGRD